jgi:hypothetical protein
MTGSAYDATPYVNTDFGAADDSLHTPTDSFYDNETFWYSFFVPERRIGGWLYTGVRQHPGITHGGMWIWDDSGWLPTDCRFYEGFSALKAPSMRGPDFAFPNGMGIEVLEPLTSYRLTYDDRDRVRADLRFDAVEPPVALQSGAPPYPKAHHFDQIGHVTGTVQLDGEAIAVDCHAIRDRSWGPRTERGYQRVGYTWGGSADLSFLTYTSPTEHDDRVHTGYLRRDGELYRITGGDRRVVRSPDGRPESFEIEAVDEAGRSLHARGTALSHLQLPGATFTTVCTALVWDVDGREVTGEDQDVWPLKEWRRLVQAGGAEPAR